MGVLMSFVLSPVPSTCSSTVSPRSTTSPVQQHIAFLEVSSPSHAQCSGELARVNDDDWWAVCYRLTNRVERTARGLLLDLGPCSDAEASDVLLPLVERHRLAGPKVRAGIGPTLTLAQLAVLTAPPDRRLTLVTPSATPEFLRTISVDTLLALHPQGSISLEVVARLHRYGLRTLGHLRHLNETALRRQFGTRIGRTLAAVSRGDDVRPLQVTSRPASARFRLRFSAPTAPDYAIAALLLFCRRVAAQLRHTGYRACALRLRLTWESGSITILHHTLREPTDNPGLLTDAVRRMLLSSLPRQPYPLAHVAASASPHALLDLRLTVEDLVPALPHQAAFWPSRDRRGQRLATLQGIAETLARRHGHPLVLQADLERPDAILADERYTLKSLTERLAPTGTDRRTVAVQTDGDPYPWRSVPYRLHWW